MPRSRKPDNELTPEALKKRQRNDRHRGGVLAQMKETPSQTKTKTKTSHTKESKKTSLKKVSVEQEKNLNQPKTESNETNPSINQTVPLKKPIQSIKRVIVIRDGNLHQFPSKEVSESAVKKEEQKEIQKEEAKPMEEVKKISLISEQKKATQKSWLEWNKRHLEDVAIICSTVFLLVVMGLLVSFGIEALSDGDIARPQTILTAVILELFLFGFSVLYGFQKTKKNKLFSLLLVFGIACLNLYIMDHKISSNHEKKSAELAAEEKKSKLNLPTTTYDAQIGTWRERVAQLKAKDAALVEEKKISKSEALFSRDTKQAIKEFTKYSNLKSALEIKAVEHAQKLVPASLTKSSLVDTKYNMDLAVRIALMLGVFLLTHFVVHRIRAIHEN